MAAVRLSTFDNPYHPFDQWYEWWVYDTTHGWNSCEVLDMEAKTSDLFSDYENQAEIERAIEEIIARDPLGLYCKVEEGKPLPPKPQWVVDAMANDAL